MYSSFLLSRRNIQTPMAAVLPWAAKTLGSYVARRGLGYMFNRFSSARRPLVRRQFKRRFTQFSRVRPAPEVKYLDSTRAAGVPAVNGDVNILNQIAEGDEYNNRTGRTIQMKMVQIDIYITPPTSNAMIDTGLVALVYDRQSYGSGAVYSDIWDTAAGLFGQQFKNIKSNGNRFVILWSMVVGPAETQTSFQHIRIRKRVLIPWKYSIVRFGGTSAAVPETGALYLTVCSSVNTATATTCFGYNDLCRVSFIDP